MLVWKTTSSDLNSNRTGSFKPEMLGKPDRKDRLLPQKAKGDGAFAPRLPETFVPGFLPARRLTLSGIARPTGIRPRPFLPFPGLVYMKRPPLEVAAIKTLDASIHRLAAIHCHETKTPGASGFAVGEKGNLRRLSEFGKEAAKVTLGGVGGDIPHIQFVHSSGVTV